MNNFRTLTTKEKALSINLDDSIYGSFSEIGAGQEVSGTFFKAGGASGTIASSTSAYDMKISDSLYGETKRYVCQERLQTILNYDYKNISDKLSYRADTTRFFSFADTVETINYHKTNQGQGWLGIRFQLSPNGPINEIVMHVLMHDNVALQQQSALGKLGVNLVYGCFNYYQNPEKFLKSLVDGIGSDRVEIDMLRFDGEDFDYLDNRLVALQLVKNGLTEATIFEPNGDVNQPADTLYKKNVLVIRGRFRPVTNVNLDMFQLGLHAFKSEHDVDIERIQCLFELNLKDLRADGGIDTKDFLDRVDTLGALGHRVLISNYIKYYKLVQYISQFTRGRKVGVILGFNNLKNIFTEEFYSNLKGGILEAFGLGFGSNSKLFVYPQLSEDNKKLMTTNDLIIPPKLKGLFDYLKDNNKIYDLEGANRDILHIYSDEVIRMIQSKENGWENMVPEIVSKRIIDLDLFAPTKKDIKFQEYIN